MTNDVIYVPPNCGCRTGPHTQSEISNEPTDVKCWKCGDEPVAYVPQETYAQAERAYYKLLSERDRLAAENERLRYKLSEIAGHLEDEVNANYGIMPRSEMYPTQMRRYDRDMEPVREARGFLEELNDGD